MTELSDAEILSTFGSVFSEFDEALRSDPHLLADMVERMADAKRLREERARNRRNPRRPKPKPGPKPSQWSIERRAQEARTARRLERNAEIIRLYREGGVTHRALAEKFGLSRKGVGQIIAAAQADTSA